MGGVARGAPLHACVQRRDMRGAGEGEQGRAALSDGRWAGYYSGGEDYYSHVCFGGGLDFRLGACPGPGWCRDPSRSMPVQPLKKHPGQSTFSPVLFKKRCAVAMTTAPLHLTQYRLFSNRMARITSDFDAMRLREH